jgi:hypothetical protein
LKLEIDPLSTMDMRIVAHNRSCQCYKCKEWIAVVYNPDYPIVNMISVLIV